MGLERHLRGSLRGLGISLTEGGGRLAALGCWCLCVLAVHEAGITGGQVGLEKRERGKC